MASLKQHLERKKNKGEIDFIQVANREFYVKSINGRISHIFYNNKYREDYLDVKKAKEKFEKQLAFLKETSHGDGLLNNDMEIKQTQEILALLK